MQPSADNYWLWVTIFSVGVAMLMMIIAGFVLWRRFKRLERMFDLLWEHGADVDKFAADVKSDLDNHAAIAMRNGEDMGRNLDVCEDYLDGVHFAIVEIGGFVRNPSGISMEERSSINAIERANLVSFNAMGGAQYLGLL